MNNQITSENYVEHALNTDCQYTPELLSRLTNSARLLHAAMGMVTEAGEFVDMLKKHIFYGKPLDAVNAKEEVGDNLWYCALAIDEMRTAMNEVLTVNIKKLKLRYPNKFTEKDAVERDTNKERVLLEGEKLPFEIFPRIGKLSQRGQDWVMFSDEVIAHIENYTVPQYQDKPNDPVTHWSTQERINALTKYAFRHGKNSREGQDELDFLKMAHFVQLAASAFKGDK